MALTVRIAALGTRVEESSDVTNMRSALFSSVISQAFPRPLPQSPLVFPALSLAIFFARAPLSERLEQAKAFLNNTFIKTRLYSFLKTTRVQFFLRGKYAQAISLDVQVILKNIW